MKPLLHTVALLGLALCSFGNESEPAPMRPFLGVHVVSVPEEVRAQTELEQGSGLMIDFIRSGSPADSAGLKTFDILTNFEDQKLLSAEQFSNLIKTSKSGQLIQLGVLRGGKNLSVKATLGEAPEIEASAIAVGAPGNDLAALLAKNPEAAKILPDLLKFLQSPNSLGSAKSAPTLGRSITMADDEGSVELIEENSLEMAVVTDPKGKVLFKGPASTDAELQKIPETIRSRIQKLKTSAKSMGQAP